MDVPHPYEASYKPCAWRNKDGSYMLRSKTYPFREHIARLGGKWDPKNRAWHCSEEAVKGLLELGMVLVMIRVHIPAHCHEEEEDSIATHKEVACGYMKLGCGWCDTIAICGDVIKIEKILDKKSARLAGVTLGGIV